MWLCLDCHLVGGGGGAGLTRSRLAKILTTQGTPAETVKRGARTARGTALPLPASNVPRPHKLALHPSD